MKVEWRMTVRRKRKGSRMSKREESKELRRIEEVEEMRSQCWSEVKWVSEVRVRKDEDIRKV